MAMRDIAVNVNCKYCRLILHPSNRHLLGYTRMLGETVPKVMR